MTSILCFVPISFLSAMPFQQHVHIDARAFMPYPCPSSSNVVMRYPPRSPLSTSLDYSQTQEDVSQTCLEPS